VELDLRKFKGCIPIEMFGRTVFPRINDASYLLTLGPYQFYWFRLRRF
jgi:maltose alpha-D-glucosyltransferase/alpha-amylase